MKKLLFGAALLSTGFLLSCNDKGGANADLESWKQKNLQFYAAMEKGDTATMGSMLTADAIDHDANPMTGADIVGRDSILAMLSQMNTCFKPGFKINILSQAMDGDMFYVLTEMKATVAEGNTMGMMPGKEINAKGVDVSKVKDGKFSEHWGFMSMKAMMEMMPPPNPSASMQPSMPLDSASVVPAPAAN